MNFLRQSSTATVILGPFIDASDGYTAVSSTATVFVKSAGSAAATATNVPSYDAAGFWNLVLAPADIGTVGHVSVFVPGAAALLPVRHDYTVVEEAIYDGVFAASAGALATASALSTAQTDLDTLTGSDGVTLATAQGNYAPATATALATAQADLDTITGSDGVTLATAQALYAPAKAGDSMALTTAALASFFTTDTGSTYSAATAGSVVKEIADNAGGSALTEAGIADAVWDELQSGHVAAGSFGEVATEIASILADTGELQTDWTNGGRLDLILDATATASALATAQSDLDTITGSDGVTLATAQALYAPAKAGDSMALTTGAVDAVWDEATSGHVTAGTYGVAVTDVLADTATSIPASIAAAQTDLDTLTDTGVVLANSASHGGASFVLTGDHIALTSTTDHGISVITSGASKDAVHLEANGTGNVSGINTYGEWTGLAASNASASAGNGIRATSNGSGAGLDTYSSTGVAIETGTSSGTHVSTGISAAINAEVVDALATDAYNESSAVPSATASLSTKINWLATLARNKIEQTSSTQTLYADNGSSTVSTATVSDDATTATRGEWA